MKPWEDETFISLACHWIEHRGIIEPLFDRFKELGDNLSEFCVSDPLMICAVSEATGDKTIIGQHEIYLGLSDLAVKLYFYDY